MNDIDKSLETKEPVEKAADLLHKIAFTESMINRYADKARVKIEAIQNELAAESKVYVDMLAVLVAELTDISKEYKNQLCPVSYDKKGKEKNKRSLLLKFGEFGFKKTSSIDVPVESYTAKLIEEDKKDLAIQTGINTALSREPKINKKLLQAYDDEVLKEFGITRNTDEVFFYEANPESVIAELEGGKKNVS